MVPYTDLQSIFSFLYPKHHLWIWAPGSSRSWASFLGTTRYTVLFLTAMPFAGFFDSGSAKSVLLYLHFDFQKFIKLSLWSLLFYLLLCGYTLLWFYWDFRINNSQSVVFSWKSSNWIVIILQHWLWKCFP